MPSLAKSADAPCALRLRRSNPQGSRSPADLPVQAPAKYELVINMKTEAFALPPERSLGLFANRKEAGDAITAASRRES